MRPHVLTRRCEGYAISSRRLPRSAETLTEPPILSSAGAIIASILRRLTTRCCRFSTSSRRPPPQETVDSDGAHSRADGPLIAWMIRPNLTADAADSRRGDREAPRGGACSMRFLRPPRNSVLDKRPLNPIEQKDQVS